MIEGRDMTISIQEIHQAVAYWIGAIGSEIL
jgi:hypothetical protein